MDGIGMISFLPILLMLVYLAVLGFIIWFAVTLIKSQKERNQILKEISTKLDRIQFNSKDGE
ncbi:hypothetical protein [Neobacillus terrae]|uniref:hypothetical protein n=1 Tax=Neobacillus terrae TaxID=3034837 RepID=UPI001408EA7C|nr:hypothetical protein [Neobacillus terrae]NHM32083.1 hypothetical protein [Neobacillus terrae]